MRFPRFACVRGEEPLLNQCLMVYPNGCRCMRPRYRKRSWCWSHRKAKTRRAIRERR